MNLAIQLVQSLLALLWNNIFIQKAQGYDEQNHHPKAYLASCLYISSALAAKTKSAWCKPPMECV